MSQTLPAALAAEIARLVDEAVPAAVRFRHERHAHPELTWKEHATAEAVAAALRGIDGIAVTTGVGKLGVVGVIEGKEPGPTVALRADMDALPVAETSGCSYASKTPGVMHACGHDGHMANLVGTAMVLAKLRHHLKGRVKLIFQPAEEGGAGARVMCEDGVLDGVDAIFGLHGWPTLACGKIFVKSGPLLASTSFLKMKVKGVGCHAAMPHLGTDQILIAARIVEALQMVSSRFVAPTEPIAVTITQVQGGTAMNVIPSEVELKGTLRAMTAASRDRCIAQIKTLAEGVATMHGATVDVEITPAYPPTVNDARATAYLETVAREALGAAAVERLDVPTMGGEDFAFYLERIPGSFFFLGVDDGRAGGYPSLHHPAFDFNDRALPVGMRVFAHAALGYAAVN